MAEESEIELQGLVERLLAFARTELGPASEHSLAQPAAQAAVLYSIRSGWTLEDAVLSVVHRIAQRDGRVADEFLASLLHDLFKVGKAVHSSRLRRYLDTGDLVQSVLGELWEEIAHIRFETRRRFIAYLETRMRWRAVDEARKLRAGSRREDLRQTSLENPDIPQSGGTPSSLVIAAEERDQLILMLARLQTRDRELLRRHLLGQPLEQIARDLGLTIDAARKAIQRAIQRMRSLAR